ncbi:MAG: SRPBCC family protein [Saprospiraceae bacterium]|nr:SRPBCC family protein [Saprospiraceae bacterium]
MKKIIISIVAALIAFIGFGLYKSSDLKTIQIVKTVTVKGAINETFDMVRYLKNFPKWSPFLAQDPAQKYEVKGTDGLVGAQYHWNGNGGEDLGFQEIVKIDTFRFVGMKCDIQKPFVAKPTFNYTFKETPNGIEVTQDFKVESAAVDAFFMWLFGAKKGMEDTNEQGMQLLKKAVEQG